MKNSLGTTDTISLPAIDKRCFNFPLRSKKTKRMFFGLLNDLILFTTKHESAATGDREICYQTSSQAVDCCGNISPDPLFSQILQDFHIKKSPIRHLLSFLRNLCSSHKEQIQICLATITIGVIFLGSIFVFFTQLAEYGW